MQTEQEKFMMTNFQRVNKLLKKIKDRLEIKDSWKAYNYYHTEFIIEIHKNTVGKQNIDEKPVDTDASEFNHTIRYDEKNAIWEIIMSNEKTINENNLLQNCDNYDENMFKFRSNLKYNENCIEIHLDIINMNNISFYNNYRFIYDTYSRNNLKIKEKEDERLYKCKDENGDLLLLKFSPQKLLLENRKLKLQNDEQRKDYHDLYCKNMMLKTEIEILEENKLCKILKNKVFRFF